jgi:type 1 glutamine amidotransferase
MRALRNLLLFVTLTCSSVSATDAPISVLIVDGFSNHDWAQTTNVVTAILERTDLFTVSRSTLNAQHAVADSDWKPDFSAYDVVIQNTNNIGSPELIWPRAAQVALEDYVASGGGLYILHSANNAFPEWEAYNQMIGLGWRRPNQGRAIAYDSNKAECIIPVGKGRKTYHGPRHDTLVETITAHPIHSGYPEQWLSADMELYQYARGPAENVTVLSIAYDPQSELHWPVDWLIRYKEGTVYNSSMGHLWQGDTYPAGFRCVAFETTLIRAVEWLGSGQVTYAVPAEFPDATQTSLRPVDYYSAVN